MSFFTSLCTKRLMFFFWGLTASVTVAVNVEIHVEELIFALICERWMFAHCRGRIISGDDGGPILFR